MSRTSETRRRRRARLPCGPAYFGALAPPPVALEAPPVAEPAATELRAIVALWREAKALPRAEHPNIGHPGSPAYQALETRIAGHSRAFLILINP